MNIVEQDHDMINKLLATATHMEAYFLGWGVAMASEDDIHITEPMMRDMMKCTTFEEGITMYNSFRERIMGRVTLGSLGGLKKCGNVEE